MKKNIHPDFYLTTYTDISSGKKFRIGSTLKEITVEISSASHPFYTGEERIIDTENRVDSFNRKKSAALKSDNKVEKKKAKKVERRQKTKKIKASKEVTLRDMLKNI